MEQFVSCFIHARAVMSNSFHALVLSLRFHRPVTILPIARKDSRLNDLLRTLGLISSPADFDASFSIDLSEEEWHEVDRHLDETAFDSILYLKNALS